MSEPMIDGLDRRRRFHAIGSEGGVRVWYVDRLWSLADALEPGPVDVGDLDVWDDEPWFAGRAPSFGQVVEHLRRIQRADLRHPIILGADGRVMDGLHRLARVLVAGGTTIEAVQFTVDPEPDLEGPWRQPGPRDAMRRQVEAWNAGDLEGYLAWVHPNVIYQHGELVIAGVDGLRDHYRGRVHGTLEVQVLREQVFPQLVVFAVEARLDAWRGRALLSWRREVDGWRLVADASQTLGSARSPSCFRGGTAAWP